jgi:tyrosyl-tRNA synthetase
MTRVQTAPIKPETQFEILARGTEEILPEGELLRRLRQCAAEGRPLRVKQGFDPTAPDIHLGHSVGLRKLRQFQELGHQVVVIVGDYTGLVGDPSGRSKTRPRLTAAEIESHSTTYLDQFFRVLERNPRPPRLPVEIHRNSEWFAGMRFTDVLELASQYTVARLLERDDFAKRMAAQQPIGVHELLYPLMQGRDSVEIRADLEMGATEQKFNLLVGRVLQELAGQAPQIVLTVPVLPGLDGVQRMSKSLGNYIGVTDPPSEMYGKVMSLPDRVMGQFWKLTTDAGADELAEVERAIADPATNPMTVKQKLAARIVRMYHGEEAAERAGRDFDTQFRRRDVPEDLEVREVPAGDIGIKDLLVVTGLAATGSAAWRAVDQGAVSIDGTRITDRRHVHRVGGPIVVRLGRKMVKVRPRP